jgi:hypothetical protein
MSMVNVYSLNDPNQLTTREATDGESRFINGCKALNLCEDGLLCYQQKANGKWMIGFEGEDYLNLNMYASCSEALEGAFKILHSKAKDMIEQLVRYSQTQLD